jgi:hypothetical protein
MSIQKVVSGCALIALLTGCGRSAVLHASDPAPTNNEAIVVMGVKPAGYEVRFYTGAEMDGRFAQDILRGPVISGMPTDGYLVARAKPGDLLGLTTIIAEGGNPLGSYKNYHACGEYKAAVVKVPDAAVVYLGHFEYSLLGDRMDIRSSSDVQAARKYLQDQYPQIKSELREGDVKVMLTQRSCAPTLIPIYIPRSR